MTFYFVDKNSPYKCQPSAFLGINKVLITFIMVFIAYQRTMADFFWTTPPNQNSFHHVTISVNDCRNTAAIEDYHTIGFCVWKWSS